jgi:hypothetical protein
VKGEITPVTVEFCDKCQELESVKNAIDQDFDTMASISYSGGNLWLKFGLDQIYCVEQFVRYNSDGTPWQTWTCSNSACTCRGTACTRHLMTLSSTIKLPQNLPSVPGCVYGDTVTMQTKGLTTMIAVREISIAGKEGEILETGT